MGLGQGRIAYSEAQAVWPGVALPIAGEEKSKFPAGRLYPSRIGARANVAVREQNASLLCKTVALTTNQGAAQIRDIHNPKKHAFLYFSGQSYPSSIVCGKSFRISVPVAQP